MHPRFSKSVEGRNIGIGRLARAEETRDSPSFLAVDPPGVLRNLARLTKMSERMRINSCLFQVLLTLWVMSCGTY